MATEKFEEQMKFLKEHGYNNITPKEVMYYINNECNLPNKSFIVTIDDGSVSSYYEALPILEKYGFKSLIFVISGRIEQKTVSQDTNVESIYFLGKDKLDEMNHFYPLMTIGSHSEKFHDLVDGQIPALTTKYEEILEDVKLSREKLYNTVYFAYPFGVSTDNYKKALKSAGYKSFYFQRQS